MAVNRYSRAFELKIPKWVESANGKLDAVARQTCFEMGKLVIEATPVDKGFLRGSWQPSIGKPDGELAAINDPGGAGSLARVSLVASQVKAGDIFYMTNGAVYAMRVEFGFVGKDSLGRTYNQTGRYYVTGTVAKFQSVVREVIADLGLAR
jgi:hypothetical protein